MRLTLALLLAVAAFGGQPETFNDGWIVGSPDIQVYAEGGAISMPSPPESKKAFAELDDMFFDGSGRYRGPNGPESIPGPNPLGQQTPAEKALEDNLTDILEVDKSDTAWISIGEGTLICNDGECYTVRFKKNTNFELAPITNERFLAAVRIYRYTSATEVPQDAAATSCASDEAQVGDACIGNIGLNVLQGGLR